MTAARQECFGKGTFSVAAEPESLIFQEVPPENRVRVDNVPPRLGNSRSSSQTLEREEAKDMRDQFGREQSEEIAGKDGG